ncbi:TPA: hypothetical protein ACGD48_002056 [Serratia marcescens]
MTNKLSELKRLTPRQIAVYRDRVAISDSDYELIPVHTGDLRALLAELEAKDKRIAELGGQLQSGFTPEALAQEERAENAEQRVSELEAKLATPVRLSCETHPRCRTQHAKDVRTAGFTIEGDE